MLKVYVKNLADIKAITADSKFYVVDREEGDKIYVMYAIKGSVAYVFEIGSKTDTWFDDALKVDAIV